MADALIDADVNRSGRGRAGPVSKYVLWASLALGCALSLVVSYGIATQSIILGSGEGRWVYGYLQPFTARPLIVSLLVSLVGCAMLAAMPEIRAARREWWLVVAWLLVGLGLQAALRSLTPFSFERMFASDGANSFFSVSGRYYVSTVLGDFDRVRAYWPLHAQSNMPGKLMLVYALRNISQRPDVLAWLVVVVSNLGGVLLYVFVRDLFDDRRMALFSLVLYLFVPAKLFFFPLLNTATPVIVLACACLVHRWLLTGGSAYAALVGVALYGLVFYEPLPLVMGLLFAALAARAMWRGDIAWRRLLAQGGLVVLAFVATFAFVRAWLGFDLMSAARQIGAHAVEFNTAAGRPYSIWVRENLREFLFGVGICQAVLFAAALGDGLAARGEPLASHRDGPGAPPAGRGGPLGRPNGLQGRLMQPITVFCLSLLAVVLATDLIGVNRGEVIRLWIFLACFAQIPAAYVCARLESRAALAMVLATTVLQGALGTAMIGFILPG